ncbi:MAG: pyrroline-5-carboxylate reductase dimerization domain-containing protein [Pseudomonadota bacterium]
MSDWPSRLLMLGCGNMGGAMLDRWLAAGLPPERISVVNISGIPPRAGIATSTEPPVTAPEVMVVAVKPQQLAVATAALAAMTGAPRILVSILAGVDLLTLKTRCPAGAVVRALPNLPVALGQGVTLLHGDDAARVTANALATPLGLAEWMADEDLFDAATALAGSGPGFTFRYIDALAAAGAALGLPEEQAARLALATVAGSAALAAKAGVSPAELADRVASKGGSTRAGLTVLDEREALVELLTRTLAAATARNAEMGAAARAL